MKKTTKTIIAALTALTLCLAVGCGGAEQEPRPPQLIDATGKVFAKYDDPSDSYRFEGFKAHVPAELIVPILNGRVTADWGDNDLAAEQRLTTRPLPEARSLDQARE